MFGANSGRGGGGLGAVAVMVGVASASGGGSASTDLSTYVSCSPRATISMKKLRNLKELERQVLSC